MVLRSVTGTAHADLSAPFASKIPTLLGNGNYFACKGEIL